METVIAFLKAAFAEGRGVLVLVAKKSGLEYWLQVGRTDRRLEFRLIDGRTSDTCSPNVKLVLHAAHLSPEFVRTIKSHMPGDALFHPTPISNTDLRRLLEAAYTPPAKKDQADHTTTTAKGNGTMTSGAGTTTSGGRSDYKEMLVSSLDCVRTAMDRLLKENDLLTGRVSSLELQVSTVQTAAAGAQGDNRGLRAQIEALELELLQSKDAVVALETERDTLKAAGAENARLRTEFEALRVERDELAKLRDKFASLLK